MKNRFYLIALKASWYALKNKSELLSICRNTFRKLRNEDFFLPGLKENLKTSGRLIKAFALRSYRQASPKNFLLILAAVLYFINPFDLIPDAVVGFGLTDDAAIASAVFKVVEMEIKKFKDWEVNREVYN